MHGVNAGIDTRYGFEIAVMKEMGWGPGDFLSAPPDMIEEIAERINARSRWEREKQRWDESTR